MRLISGILSSAVLAALIVATPASAADMKAKAEAMGAKVAGMIKSDADIAKFMEMAKFFDSDQLYGMVVDTRTGKVVAHSHSQAMVGKQMAEMKDADGKMTTKAAMEMKEAGWTSYMSKDPISGEMKKNMMYVVMSGPFMVMVGDPQFYGH